MGLLDMAAQVAGGLLQGQGAAAGGQGGTAMLASLMSGGGLQQLLGQLQQGGLSDAVASWIGTGANQPVTAQAISDALSGSPLAGIAAQLGVDPQQFAGQLANWLPQVVDQLSPQGSLPEGGPNTDDLSSVLAKVLG